MKKFLFLVCLVAGLVSAKEIIVNFGETRTIRDLIFEDYTGDFVIKNNGTLILENCTFKNNKLGSDTNKAILYTEKVVAPIVNFGILSVSNCKFINNFSWNSALTDNFEAQAAAGAIVNFGELDLADNNVFERNSYQSGHFVIIRNNYIEQFAYIGNDMIFNAGNVEIIRTPENNQQQQNTPNLSIDVVLLENIVKDKAEFLVKTNKQTTVKINVFNNLGNSVFSTQRQVQNGEIIVWNLTNQAGSNVASGNYMVKVEAENFIKNMQVGVQR